MPVSSLRELYEGVEAELIPDVLVCELDPVLLSDGVRFRFRSDIVTVTR